MDKEKLEKAFKDEQVARAHELIHDAVSQARAMVGCDITVNCSAESSIVRTHITAGSFSQTLETKAIQT